VKVIDSYICMYTNMIMDMYTYICIYTYLCVYIFIHLCIRYIYIYLCVCTYIYQNIGKQGVKVIDKSLSGHCSLFNTCQMNLKVIDKDNGISLGMYMFQYKCNMSLYM
jgi:hypothetical protein